MVDRGNADSLVIALLRNLNGRAGDSSVPAMCLGDLIMHSRLRSLIVALKSSRSSRSFSIIRSLVLCEYRILLWVGGWTSTRVNFILYYKIHIVKEVKLL